MSVMTRKQSAVPAADMQWRARRIAIQASKLAEQAGPATRQAAETARRGASDAAQWATPRIGRARAWLAVRAARGSVSVTETIGPRVSAMLETAARKLDPPRPARRRWPRMLAGVTLLAAGAAVTAAMALRARQGPPPMPPRPPARDAAGQHSVLNPSAEPGRTADTESAGLSRSR